MGERGQVGMKCTLLTGCFKLCLLYFMCYKIKGVANRSGSVAGHADTDGWGRGQVWRVYRSRLEYYIKGCVLT